MTAPGGRSSWPWVLAELRATGHQLALREDGRLHYRPTPPAALLEALRRHREPIARFLALEAVALLPKAPGAAWKPLGGDWWEDGRGTLHWCEAPPAGPSPGSWDAIGPRVDGDPARAPGAGLQRC